MTDRRHLTEQAPDCAYCDGDGFFADHEDSCYEAGDCSCSGVQVECQECLGTGKRLFEESPNDGIEAPYAF